METSSASLALCVGNSPVTGEFPSQRPVTRSFDVSFDLRLNKLLSKQSRRWGFEAPYSAHYDVIVVETPRCFLFPVRWPSSGTCRPKQLLRSSLPTRHAGRLTVCHRTEGIDAGIFSSVAQLHVLWTSRSHWRKFGGKRDNPRIDYNVNRTGRREAWRPAMMTQSNGNIFRVTGHLYGEFTGDRWIPLTKANDARLWCFLWSSPDQQLSKQSRRRWFETPSRSL